MPDYARALESASAFLEQLEQAELGPDEVQAVVDAAVSDCLHHLNPGFLEWRKAVSDDYTAVEFRDEGNGFVDVRGRRFIDCLGGYGVYNLGHRHPTVVRAVRAQLERQALKSWALLDPVSGLLARLLAQVTPGDLQYAFFGNSGTEAVEGALKLARLRTGRQTIVAAVNGFHGKSMGSLSATAKAMYRQPFFPLVPGFRHVPFGDADALATTLEVLHQVGEDAAAVILEPIQGEGGVVVPPDDYLPRVRELCDAYGALLILDEVQTGMARTGRFWACEHWAVAPDLLCTSKALGGGVMPIGAFVGTADVWQPMIPKPGLHSTTFGSNPLACAAAVAAIQVTLAERLWERAAALGEVFLAGLRELVSRYPDVAADARGRGLLLGIELASHEAGYRFAKELFRRNILVAGTMINLKTIRIEPPLTIERATVDRVLDAMDDALAACRAAGVAASGTAAAEAASGGAPAPGGAGR